MVHTYGDMPSAVEAPEVSFNFSCYCVLFTWCWYWYHRSSNAVL